jgi:putative restriction endonuclease
LSIRTGAGSPYDDQFVDDTLAYRYRGDDPGHRENVGLRSAMHERLPLVYFHAVVEGRYLAVWPVFVVGDEPQQLRFWVQAEAGVLQIAGASISGSLEGTGFTSEAARRADATRLVQQRLHQRGFREIILDAYRSQCALLDAAHIVPDRDGGQPVVPNGLALCKIHHAAFDHGVVGVRPSDLRSAVRPDILEEIDGPMLRHGLQDLQN